MKSTQALTAQAIRKDLKKAFPSQKFSVTSSGDSVRVTWVDGITVEKVEEITSKYSQGNFNGMIDSYDYSNSRSDIPQVKYIFTDRNYSDATLDNAFKFIKLNYSGFENIKTIHEQIANNGGFYDTEGLIRKKLRKIDLINGFCDTSFTN